MTVYQAIGGAETCRNISAAFYARVARDPLLRPIFPKSFHCAIPAFAAYLTQFLGGPCEYSGRRYHLSLREAHARFRIGRREREAWLRQMNGALSDVGIPQPARGELSAFFEESSRWLTGEADGEEGAGHGDGEQGDGDLQCSWRALRALEETVAAVRRNDAAGAITMAESSAVEGCFARDRAALTSLLAIMFAAVDPDLHDYARRKVSAHPELVRQRHTSGRTLLHDAADAGNLPVVEWLLQMGADPNALDGGGHAPLYGVGNACSVESGAAVVHALVRAGAHVDARDGVQRCTALHMAARRGNVPVAEALIECGADIAARDRRGDTPLRRAMNCRKKEMVEFLNSRGLRQFMPRTGWDTE